MANRLLVVDLDGTLMNSDFYRKPTHEACVLIMRKLGECSPTLNEIKRRHNELDRAMIYQKDPDTGRLYYYTKKRFPMSLVRIYEVLCEDSGVEPSLKTRNQLFRLGQMAFDQTRYIRKIKPESFPFAKFHKEQDDILIILTKGDSRVQNDKKLALKKAGLLKYFAAFIVVTDSKYRYFKLIKSRHPGMKCYSVGDTYADDIRPAIKAGFTGIWIPSEGNWKEIGKINRIDRSRSKRRSKRFSHLMEVVERYHSI